MSSNCSQSSLPFKRKSELNLKRPQKPFLLLITTSNKGAETESKKRKKKKKERNYEASEPVVYSAVGVELYIWLCDSRSMQPGAEIEMNWLSPIKLQLNKRTSLGESSETSSSHLLITSRWGGGIRGVGGGQERGVGCVPGSRWARSISSESSRYQGGGEVMDERESAWSADRIR